MRKKKKEKVFKVTMTESQLRLMSNAVEDWCRFLSGQCEMSNASMLLDNHHEIYETLQTVYPFVVPELWKKFGNVNASYSWNGGDCPNKYQKEAIAMSYGIYRQVLHYFATHKKDKDSWNVYNSPTLTCDEQGPLIQIEEIKD